MASPIRHSVQFYESDRSLVESVASFAIEGIESDEAVILVAKSEHLAEVLERLHGLLDLSVVLHRGQLILLDAHEILAQIMVGDRPDRRLFMELFGPVYDELAAKFSGVRVYGELVQVLCEEGDRSSVLAIENLWNEFAEKRHFRLLCGYAISGFSRAADIDFFGQVCECHSHVRPTERFSGQAQSDESLRLIAELQQRNLALRTESSAREVIERELRANRDELLAAKNAAESASYAKSRFLANMSHEIRSPLTAILGFTELMKDSTLGFAQRAGYAEIVSRNGRRLSTLLNDILDLSKLDSGKLDVELAPMSLSLLISEVVALFREEAEAKGLRLFVEESPEGMPDRICSDATRIHQVLLNLVGNAVKFTKSGFVRISYGSEDVLGRRRFSLRVEDSGIGMTPEQQRRLFQPFVQADASAARKYGGTGMGLALSRALAQALGGDLLLHRSDVGEGSVFLFSFDPHLARLTESRQKRTNEEIICKVLPEGGMLQGVRILLAEDSADNQLLIRRYLAGEGAEVDIAENGLEAVEKALNGDFHLILMDVMMPICDGYDATRRLRHAGYEKPIVALTAHALREERERSFAEGCNEHLTKPINRRQLVASIAKFVFGEA